MRFSRSGSALSTWRAAWLLVAALALPPVHAASQVSGDPEQVQTQRNRAAVGEAFAAWAAGGQTFFDDILAPDVVWTIKGSGPSAGVHRGKQDLIERAVKPLSARLASPIRPTVRNLWAEGEHVIIHWEIGRASCRERVF